METKQKNANTIAKAQAELNEASSNNQSLKEVLYAKTQSIMNTRMNKFFFTIILLLATYLVFSLVQPYLSLLVLALITVLLFKPVYEFILRKFRNHKNIATATTIIVVIACLIIPIYMIIQLAISQVITFYNDLNNVITGNSVTTVKIISGVNDFFTSIGVNYTITEEMVGNTVKDQIQPIATFLANQAIEIGKSVIGILPAIFMYIIFLAGLFPNYDKLVKYIQKISPLEDAVDAKYIRRITEMSKCMMKGTLVISLLQGLIVGLLLWALGVYYPVFWAMVAVFFSIIPVGSGVVTIPVGIAMILAGNVWQGILILLTQVLVLQNVDPILRPRMVSKDAEMNPILLIISVLGGVTVFGLWGVIYGPVIMIFFLTTLEVYSEYYNRRKIGAVSE